MFGRKVKHFIQTVRMLKQMQEQNITDDYTCGLYNGLELALSVLQEREPEFKTFEKEPEVIENQDEMGRTVYSGINIKRK